MGTVMVAVGCPHRLRQPIGEHTARPCQFCAATGLPGWPRLAWAMTVDYGPRLSKAATTGVRPDVTVPPPRPALTAETLARASAAFLNVVAHPRLIERAAQVSIEPGDLNIVMHEQTERDFAANVVRFEAVRRDRLRFDR